VQTCALPISGSEVREPREGAEAHPGGREQDVEDHNREGQRQPPESPAPERDPALRHETSAFAPASARRRSTSLITRAAVSSIESSEISITGQPSFRWIAWACSSSA